MDPQRVTWLILVLQEGDAPRFPEVCSWFDALTVQCSDCTAGLALPRDRCLRVSDTVFCLVQEKRTLGWHSGMKRLLGSAGLWRSADG